MSRVLAGLLRGELVVVHDDGRVEKYELGLEEIRVAMRWRAGPYAGTLVVEKGRIIIDVREGLGAGLRSLLLRRGPGIGEMMEAARALACETGLRVELRAHGVRLAGLECGEKR